jgi:hypothetical protein
VAAVQELKAQLLILGGPTGQTRAWAPKPTSLGHFARWLDGFESARANICTTCPELSQSAATAKRAPLCGPLIHPGHRGWALTRDCHPRPNVLVLVDTRTVIHEEGMHHARDSPLCGSLTSAWALVQATVPISKVSQHKYLEALP